MTVRLAGRRRRNGADRDLTVNAKWRAHQAEAAIPPRPIPRERDRRVEGCRKNDEPDDLCETYGSSGSLDQMCAARARLGHFGKNGIVDRSAATVTETVRTCVKAFECTFDSVEFLAKR